MLNITACIDRPPMPLDGDVDVDGLFDGFKSCVKVEWVCQMRIPWFLSLMALWIRYQAN